MEADQADRPPYEKENVRRDGTPVPGFIADSILPGPPREVAAFILDVAERKVTETALREDAERLARILEATSGGVWDWNIQTGAAVFSARCAHMLGYEPDEFARSYEEWVLLVHPDDLERVEQAHVDHFNENKEFSIELRMREKSGPWHWIHNRGLLIERDAKGNPLRMVGTHTDIQGYKAAEEALRASEASYRMLVEGSADGILVSDPTFRYVEANPAICRMLGYARSELLGMRPGDLTAHDDPVGSAGLDEQLAEFHAGTGLLERRYRRKDGTSLPVEVSFTHLPDGRLQRNVRDISERLTAEADEVREMRIRTALTEALHHIRQDATVEEAGQAICDVLATLPAITLTGVAAFSGEDDVVMIAGAAPASFAIMPGDRLPPEPALYLREHAEKGPWAEYWTTPDALGPWGESMDQAGLRAAAFGPIVHGDHVDGVLGMWTADEDYARTLVERMPGLAAFTATTSGLLGDKLHMRRHGLEQQRLIGRVLDEHAFHSVFQPIVDLASGGLVAYEGLTRFDSGQPPDRDFADAWSVGLGPDLEIATLEAVVAASGGLPHGHWLTINVSPRLLLAPSRLGEILRAAERPLVVEITEHEAIGDYAAVRAAIRAIGSDVRLAVENAGAGIANFARLVELRPDFVKLDTSLVHRVNADLARQALVIAMRHFSRNAGCRLIAEGIETDTEAATLRGLGVEFGQGYLLGRPEPVEAWQHRPRNGPQA